MCWDQTHLVRFYVGFYGLWVTSPCLVLPLPLILFLPASILPKFLFENICAHWETFSDSTCFSCSHDMTHLGCSECSLPCILLARIPRHVCRIPASVLHTAPLQQPALPRHLSAQQCPSCDLVSACPLCHHWKAITSFYLIVKFKFIKQQKQ